MFIKGKKTKVSDITNASSTLWTSSDTSVLLPPISGDGGLYTGAQSGCACINASSGGIISLPVGIAVLPSSGTGPTCPPCPTPIATPTPTAVRSSVASVTNSTNTVITGVLQWTFDSAMPVEGPVAGSSTGTAYFTTSDSLLHAVVAPGVEQWQTREGGNPVAVSPDGSTVYARGADGKLYAFGADGKPEWNANVSLSQGPLAASADSVFAVSSAGQLVAVTSPGLVQWQVPLSGTVARAVVSPDGGVIVAVADGSVTDVSASGVVRWTFAPAGGFAGSLAVESGNVYVGSGSGAVYAIDASSGSQIWQFQAGASLLAGPVADSDGSVFFASNSIYAVSAGGKTLWSRPLLTGGPVVLAGTPGGVFIATNDGIAMVVADDGAMQWATESFGTVESASLSPADILYVVNANGRIYAVK